MLGKNRCAIGDTSLTRTAGPRPVGGVLPWWADVTVTRISEGVCAVTSQETTVAVAGLERWSSFTTICRCSTERCIND